MVKATINWESHGNGVADVIIIKPTNYNKFITVRLPTFILTTIDWGSREIASQT